MLEGWEIRQPVNLHRIWDTRIGYAINQWRIGFSHSVKIRIVRENAIPSQVFEQAIASVGKSNRI